MPLWFIIVVLGIVEGITEFLPVSSTGHLLIAERFLQAFRKDAHQTDLFNIVIQSGAVLAVLPLFRDRLRQFVFNWRERAAQDYFIKICVAFVITGLPMFILEKRHWKLPEDLQPVAWALLIGGAAFVIVEKALGGRPHKDSITWPIVVAVGIGQIVAGVFPGTSRSGSTILLCLILGLNRFAATEFCFLVGIPTMLAAGGWKIFQALRHPNPIAPPENWSTVVLGSIVSAVVSFAAVKWLLGYIRTHTFIAFGWYRIGLALAIGILLLTLWK